MIRINLQKELRVKKSRSVPVPAKWVVPLVLCVVFGIGIVVAVNMFSGSSPEKRLSVAAPLSSGVEPSTHYRPNMVEDVVREIGSERRDSRFLDIPYEHMSVAEKINYEVHFARNVVMLLDRSMPPGIGLASLEMDKFQTVYAVGVSSSRELVESMFSAFREEKVDLLPQPLSYIKGEGSSGFRFVITSKARFGLDHSDPFQVIDHLPFREGLDQLIKQFSTLASKNQVRLSSSPRQISSHRTGNYRRILYKAQGETTYREFVRFILNLHKEKFPCAFEKINLSARGNEAISLEMDILFTVRE